MTGPDATPRCESVDDDTWFRCELYAGHESYHAHRSTRGWHEWRNRKVSFYPQTRAVSR